MTLGSRPQSGSIGSPADKGKKEKVQKVKKNRASTLPGKARDEKTENKQKVKTEEPLAATRRAGSPRSSEGKKNE